MSRGIYDKVNKVRIPIAGAQVPNVDETIIEDSPNPVAGGAVYDALQNIHIDVDSALSETSENPVQNKIVKSALDNKANNSDIPTKITDLTNDGNFVQDANYMHIDVDSALSSTSTNPIQNKIIKSALDNKADSSNVPTKTSDLTNDSNFVADANYTHINVDSAMSSSSTNTVQNKVIKQYVDALQTAITNGDIQIGIPVDPATTPTTDGAVWITTT